MKDPLPMCDPRLNVTRGKEARTIPVHLQRRVKIAWGSYEASRRQVQAYMVSRNSSYMARLEAEQA